jgi:hypothetical protein
MQNPTVTYVPPCEGYVVELGGQFNSEYGSFTRALKAGLELKHKDSHAEVKVYDASERAPMPAGLSEQS